MEQLSSCYFCGAALDASLDEYPVVPRSVHPDPDDQRTVVLCQGCREKLGTVVETVVSAVGDDSAGAPEPTAGDGSRSTGDGSRSSSEDPLDEDGWVDADELSSSDDADQPSADAEKADATSDDDSKDVTYTTSTAAGGRKTVSGEPESIRDERETGDDGAADDDRNDEDAYGSSTSAGETDEDDGPSLTRLEYNKVMRLLQNREFPVDSAEIRTVATSAYQISESEFDAVIDAAKSRGLIDEENGQFVAAE